MEAARCQLGNLLSVPSLPKWTMSLLIRYLPRGLMSALLMPFLSSPPDGRSGPIASCSCPWGCPLCLPHGCAHLQPGSLELTPLLRNGGLKGVLLKAGKSQAVLAHAWCVYTQSWNWFSLPRQCLGGEAISEVCPLRLMRPDSLFTRTLKSLPLSA